MMKMLLFLVLPFLTFNLYGQINILATNPTAEQILLGNYDPNAYKAGTVINHPNTISQGIYDRVSPDSLRSYLEVLRTFETRNSGSDTLSSARGIGAARRWIFLKFQQFSAENENRLLTSYLQFDQNICGILQHKNVFAVLPGMDTSDKSIIIVEGHMDTRCDGLCDTSCLSEGMEDNGSGTALVMELARVMSRYTYNHTIVFMTTTAEEQGLSGARAFAQYAKQKGVQIKAVLNNDVVGGIICGQTSSPPSCPGLNNIDSTQVRLFSFGTHSSPHKQLCRFIKLQYKEMIRPYAAIPMTISIMNDEDRSGRGGDHIPFREKGFTAMRFTSANEHGDASNSAGYSDRQHTSTDILGVDTDADMIIDSFFVDFNYLARNTVINGNAAAMIAIGPKSPNFVAHSDNINNLTINIIDPMQYMTYRIGVRTTNNDWDTVYTASGSLTHNLNVAHDNYKVSVAAVDANGVESLFSGEFPITTGVNDITASGKTIELLQNSPNPADETTTISVLVRKPVIYNDAVISVSDITGREISRLNIQLKEGMNEIPYTHDFTMPAGTYTYTLIVDGITRQSKKMVFSY